MNIFREKTIINNFGYTANRQLEIEVRPANISGNLPDVIPGWFAPAMRLDDEIAAAAAPPNVPGGSSMRLSHSETSTVDSSAVWRPVVVFCCVIATAVGCALVLALSYLLLYGRRRKQPDQNPDPESPLRHLPLAPSGGGGGGEFSRSSADSFGEFRMHVSIISASFSKKKCKTFFQLAM